MDSATASAAAPASSVSEQGAGRYQGQLNVQRVNVHALEQMARMSTATRTNLRVGATVFPLRRAADYESGGVQGVHVKGCMWYCKASAAGCGNMRRPPARLPCLPAPAPPCTRLHAALCEQRFPAKRDLLNAALYTCRSPTPGSGRIGCWSSPAGWALPSPVCSSGPTTATCRCVCTSSWAA